MVCSPTIRQLLLITSGIAITLALGSPSTAGECARMEDGTWHQGRLLGEQAEAIRFVATDRDAAHSLDSIEQIQLPRASDIVPSESPLRIFTLQGGGRISGELIGGAKEQITLCVHGQTLVVPQDAIASIAQPTGEEQILYEDFNAGPLATPWKIAGPPEAIQLATIGPRTAARILPAGRLTYPLAAPLEAGRLSLSFLDPAAENLKRQCFLELVFSDGEQERSVRIQLASEREYYSVTDSAAKPLNEQRLKRSTAWQQLTVLFDELRFQVLIGSHLLAFGPSPQAKLHGIRWVSEPIQGGASAPEALPFWMDDLQLSRGIKPNDKPALGMGQKSHAALASGDVLYGTLEHVNAHRVTLHCAFGEVTLPWTKLRRVTCESSLSVPAPSKKLRPVTGWHTLVRLQRRIDRPRDPGDEFSAAMVAAAADSLTFDHPSLGRMQVPKERIDRLVLQYEGLSYVLSAERVPLGNRVRKSFRGAEPVGTVLPGQFTLNAVPTGSAFLRIEVAELEPAGPDTPPGSRFLSELRNGGLGTNVVLNGTPLGRLNDLISTRPTPDAPRSLRIPIPPGVLKAGENQWRLEQTPRRHHSQEFDDCEVGRVTLEIETD